MKMNKTVDFYILRGKTKTWKNTNRSMFSTYRRWMTSSRSWNQGTSNTKAERGGTLYA